MFTKEDWDDIKPYIGVVGVLICAYFYPLSFYGCALYVLAGIYCSQLKKPMFDLKLLKINTPLLIFLILMPLVYSDATTRMLKKECPYCFSQSSYGNEYYDY